MKLSPSWQAASCAATQELHSILWNPKVHYRVYTISRSVLILSQINPVHTTPSYLRSILISTHLRLGLPSGLFPSSFPTNILHAFLFSQIRATCLAHRILFDFTNLTILGEKYKLWSSSLCSFLQPPVTSSLFGPNILLNTLFSDTLSLCSSLNVRRQVPHPYRTTGKIIVLHILIFTSLDSRREDKSFWPEW
jgi:hypothetical protein